jgi:hypothetical protein
LLGLFGVSAASDAFCEAKWGDSPSQSNSRRSLCIHFALLPSPPGTIKVRDAVQPCPDVDIRHSLHVVLCGDCRHKQHSETKTGRDSGNRRGRDMTSLVQTLEPRPSVLFLIMLATDLCKVLALNLPLSHSRRAADAASLHRNNTDRDRHMLSRSVTARRPRLLRSEIGQIELQCKPAAWPSSTIENRQDNSDGFQDAKKYSQQDGLIVLVG